VENDFISKGKMKISYQVGMDGVKHSFTLPHYALILIIVLFIFLVVSTIMMFTMAGSNAQRNEVLKRLETENKELRAKLDFYAATVDSIYKRLNDLQIKIKENPEDYPTLNLKQGKKAEFVFEPALGKQMENLETKLATILVLISEPAKAIPALPVGENPADYIPSIILLLAEFQTAGVYEFILFVMKLNSIMALIFPMKQELQFMLLPRELLKLLIMKQVMAKE